MQKHQKVLFSTLLSLDVLQLPGARHKNTHQFIYRKSNWLERRALKSSACCPRSNDRTKQSVNKIFAYTCKIIPSTLALFIRTIKAFLSIQIHDFSHQYFLNPKHSSLNRKCTKIKLISQNYLKLN